MTMNQFLSKWSRELPPAARPRFVSDVGLFMQAAVNAEREHGQRDARAKLTAQIRKLAEEDADMAESVAKFLLP